MCFSCVCVHPCRHMCVCSRGFLAKECPSNLIRGEIKASLCFGFATHYCFPLAVFQTQYNTPELSTTKNDSAISRGDKKRKDTPQSSNQPKHVKGQKTSDRLELKRAGKPL